MSAANTQPSSLSPVDWAGVFVSHARKFIGVSVKEQLRVEEPTQAQNQSAKPKKEEDLSYIQLKERLEAKKAELRDQSHKNMDPNREKKQRKKDKNNKVKDNKAHQNSKPKTDNPAQNQKVSGDRPTQNGLNEEKKQGNKPHKEGDKPGQQNAKVAPAPAIKSQDGTKIDTEGKPSRGAWDKKAPGDQKKGGQGAPGAGKDLKKHEKGGQKGPKAGKDGKSGHKKPQGKPNGKPNQGGNNKPKHSPQQAPKKSD